MPSQPRMMKSWVLSLILTLNISGSGMTTFGFPWYFSNLAWQSPKVLDTLSLPGITLTGPYVTGPPGPDSMMLLF